MAAAVAPLAGAWIEISRVMLRPADLASLPSRERGLKFPIGGRLRRRTSVAPLAGAWIEMIVSGNLVSHTRFRVAPLAGAWIEILMIMYLPDSLNRRSPRGSVD